MNSLIEQLKSLRSRVRLEPARAEKVRQNLVHFIEAEEAVRVRETERHTIQRSISTRFTRFRFTTTVSAMLVLAVLGASTSFAAQRSLPGELLYPVKVGVNEQIVGLLQFSSQTKAHYEVELVDERLKEAVSLSVQGKLDATTTREIEARLETNISKTERSIDSLRTRGDTQTAADVASDFESVLRVGSAVLGEAGKREDRAGSLKGRVDAVLHRASGVRTEIETEVTSPSGTSTEDGARSRNVESSAKRRIRDAEEAVQSVRTYVDANKDQVGEQAASDAKLRLDEVEKKLDRAKQEESDKSFGDAFNSGNEAVRAAQEVHGLTKARADWRLDVQIGNKTEDEKKQQENEKQRQENGERDAEENDNHNQE